MFKNKYGHRLIDALRLTNPLSVDGTVANITEDARKTIPPFNYGPSETIARLTISGKITEAQIKARFKDTKNKASRINNTAASTLLLSGSKEISEEPVLCHKWQKVQPFQIREDLNFKMRFPFFFVKNGRVIVPQIQFCKSFHFTKFHWSLMGGIIRDVIREEFQPAESDVAFIDLSAPPKSDARKFNLIYASTLPIIPANEVAAYFEVYAKAYDICVERGIERVKKPKHQPGDDSATDQTDGLFD